MWKVKWPLRKWTHSTISKHQWWIKTDVLSVLNIDMICFVFYSRCLFYRSSFVNEIHPFAVLRFRVSEAFQGHVKCSILNYVKNTQATTFSSRPKKWPTAVSIYLPLSLRKPGWLSFHKASSGSLLSKEGGVLFFKVL